MYYIVEVTNWTEQKLQFGLSKIFWVGKNSMQRLRIQGITDYFLGIFFSCFLKLHETKSFYGQN